MRRAGLVAAVAVGCGASGGSVEAPRSGAAAAGEMVLVPAPPVPSACTGHGNLIRLAAEDERAPVIVLREDRVGVEERGTLLMWADGTVAATELAHGPVPSRTIHVSPAEVAALQARLLAELADRPRRIDLLRRDPRSTRAMEPGAHGPETRVFVRDPDGWRVVVARGVDRDDLAAPDRERAEALASFAAERAAYDAERARGNIADWSWPPLIPDAPPPWFIALYRTLLDALPPPDAPPLAPDVLRIRLTADYRDLDHRGSAFGEGLPWPADLPVPPPELEPAYCANPENECLFELAPAQHAAALALRPRLRDAAGRLRPVEHGGHRWIVTIVERHRGQQIIQGLSWCLGDLAEAARE